MRNEQVNDKIVAAFQERFGRRPTFVVRAPGRVNLIGGHTDYNEGFVLPVAIDRAAWVAVAPIARGEADIWALDLGESATFPLDSIPRSVAKDGGWADYPRGVAWALRERGLSLSGMEAVLSSNVPIGAGLSSSAAVELAFAYAWQQLSGFELDRRALALICQKAENDYVGVECGAMDQMASALGVRGHALLLDCRTLGTEAVPLPPDLAIVVADTGVRRQLAASEYNKRRAQCEQAVETLSDHRDGIHALRDVDEQELKRLGSHLPESVYRRARHVVTENARVLRAAEALREGDASAVGALMKASHASLRDDYEVSSPELDVLAEAAWEVDGGYGARLTGAGFGGCIVALVAVDALTDFQTHLSGVYEQAFERRPEVYVCHSADGVGVVRDK